MANSYKSSYSFYKYLMASLQDMLKTSSLKFDLRIILVSVIWKLYNHFAAIHCCA
jgi:hypothetical protein